jgi:hypothetical protein
MPEITIRHEIDCDEDTFWSECVFNDDYNRKLYLETLKFPGYQVVDSRDLADTRTRTIKIDPPVTGLPGPVKKVLGDRFAYTEKGVFDKKTKRYTFTVTPSTMAEKTHTSGELWCEKIGDGSRITRIARIAVEVKVMMVGKMIEEKILGDLRTSYDAAAKFTNEYLAAKKK